MSRSKWTVQRARVFESLMPASSFHELGRSSPGRSSLSRLINGLLPPPNGLRGSIVELLIATVRSLDLNAARQMRAHGAATPVGAGAPSSAEPSSAADLLQQVIDAACQAATSRPLTCAVVGSAPNLVGRRLGRHIDSHDLVFRVNDAPTAGYELDVGERTSFRVSGAGQSQALLTTAALRELLHAAAFNREDALRSADPARWGDFWDAALGRGPGWEAVANATELQAACMDCAVEATDAACAACPWSRSILSKRHLFRGAVDEGMWLLFLDRPRIDGLALVAFSDPALASRPGRAALLVPKPVDVEPGVLLPGSALLAPSFMEHLRVVWGNARRRPTAGMLMLGTALHICDSVDLYGVSMKARPNQPATGRGSWWKYYRYLTTSQYNGNVDATGGQGDDYPHDLEYERRLREALIAAGVIRDMTPLHEPIRPSFV